MTTILILNNQKTEKMKKMFLLAIIGLNCLVANAQVCDLELLLHVSPQKTNRALSLIFCQGETKHTYWIKESRIPDPIQMGIIASVLRPNVPNLPILSLNQLRN
ncbi:hypothetical protein [Sodaliphilus sp.]|uniref:hypothetical protein n=1 Tax=Sodaliphilus sp. TaxID=2815818 RepID=UPI00389008CE